MATEKFRIVIVEDEAVIAMDIKESLEGLGYEVVGIASSAEEAWRVVAAKKPALVLMDIVLRGPIDGIEAASKIREQHNIPVVFLTAHADNSTFNRAKIVEPYGYVLKPFRQIELRTVIELAIYKHEVESHRRASGKSTADISATDGHKALDEKFLASLQQQSHTPEELAAVTDLFAKMPIFSQVKSELLKSIAAVSHVKSYASGEFIVFEGDSKPAPFIVMDGRAALVKSSPNGKDLIIELIGPGEPFGLLSGIESSVSPFSLKAQLKTRILWIPAPVVQTLFADYPELSRSLISAVLARLRKAHDFSRTLAHESVDVRVASVLLAMIPSFAQFDKTSDTHVISLSRQELAEMCGIASETASRVANAFERDGVLDLSLAGKVKVLKRAELERLVNVG